MNAHKYSALRKGKPHALTGFHYVLLGAPVEDGEPASCVYVIFHIPALRSNINIKNTNVALVNNFSNQGLKSQAEGPLFLYFP
jgi:hypothetical protein